MDEVWAKIPADVRGPIAAHAAKLHSTLSEQGRKLAGYAPIQEVVNEYADYFDGRVKDENGQPITVAGGIKYLFGMQRAMDTNAVQTLLEIADAYKARDGLIAVLSGQARPEQFQRQQAPQNAAGLSPADVQALVKQAVEESTTQTTVKQVVEQWAADKPHYAAVEADLPQFIALARQRLGEDAAAVAILDQAYELAVFANPSLRPTLMTAASAMPAAAPVVDGRKAEAARRANAVNVTSTASGKSRPLTEDEELAAIYDKAQKAS